MVIIMIVAAVAVVALAIAIVAYLLVRGSRVTTTTEADFDQAYDELVAEGEVADGDDRTAAWRDFHSWEAKNEEERRAWEEEPDV